MPGEDKNRLLRKLPSIDGLLARPAVEVLCERFGRPVVVGALRQLVEQMRQELLSGRIEDAEGLVPSDGEIVRRVEELARPPLRPVLNATGVVIHTNLGRAPLARDVLEHLSELAAGYCNLEYRLEDGRRGSRADAVRGLLVELSGAEDAMVVNNNAAAVYLALRVVASGGEVVVSRGELVEIGGSFRIPDVMAASGARLVEVGTTNRTHLRDYERAIGPETAMVLRVHRSNFEMVGFCHQPELEELASLSHKHQLPLMVDMGWATFLRPAPGWLGSGHHPADVLKAGADLVCFSGDKILGGPQCGIVLGRADIVGRMARDPMARALRVGKLTLGALWRTLEAYRRGDAERTLPVVEMLMEEPELLRKRARKLARMIRSRLSGAEVDVVKSPGKVGGGALPLVELEGWAAAVHAPGAAGQRLARKLREAPVPVVARIEQDRLILDTRCIPDNRLKQVADSLAWAWDQRKGEER